MNQNGIFAGITESLFADADETAVSSFLMGIFPFSSARCSRLTLSTNASRRVDENLTISSKLFISKGYCESFVEKRFELRSIVPDITGHLLHIGRCPFLFQPLQQHFPPLRSPAGCGIQRSSYMTVAPPNEPPCPA